MQELGGSVGVHKKTGGNDVGKPRLVANNTFIYYLSVCAYFVLMADVDRVEKKTDGVDNGVSIDTCGN